MKAQEGVAVPTPPEGTPPATQSGQWDGKVAAAEDDFGDLNEPSERSQVPEAERAPGNKPGAGGAQKAPGPARGPAHDSFLTRERRATVVSSIPAQLAKSMMHEPREAGTPATQATQPTRPVADASQPHLTGATPADEVLDTYSVELLDDEPELPPREHIQSLISRARTLMEAGNLGGAVITADQTLAEAAKAPQTEVADLVKAARPLFDRIFAAYVGLLTQTPVRLRSDADLVGQELGERTKYLLSHIDGRQTLEQVSTRTGIPPVEAMKIAASLLAAGIIRV
jgi:hypothetical protein